MTTDQTDNAPVTHEIVKADEALGELPHVGVEASGGYASPGDIAPDADLTAVLAKTHQTGG